MFPLLKVFREWVVVAADRRVVFLRSDGGTWCHEIDPGLPLEKGRLRKYFDADSDDSDDDEHQAKAQTQQQQHQSGATTTGIVSLEVHEGKSLLAVATGDKSLYLFEIVLPGDGGKDGRLNFLSRRLVSRASSCMRFAPSGTFLIVCDKGGDCFKYDCSSDEVRKPGRWLLGHMSQVLDAVIDADENLIITSDRDEKIRVTSYPDCHSIETFCLGHTEFVSQLAFSGGNLLSLSGDKTLRAWNHRDGRELARTEMKLPGNKLALGQLSDGTILLAVLAYEPTTIAVYKVVDEVNCELVQDLTAEPGQVFSAISFTKDGSLVGIVLPISDGAPALVNFTFDGKVLLRATTNDPMAASFAEQFKACNLPYVDSVSFLFKKKFDNITDYHERKRKRIEENNKAA